MSITPYAFQKESVYSIERFGGRVLLANEMGLGKTPTALWALARQKFPSFPALIVTPASVKYQWEYEASNVIRARAKVLEGQTPPRNVHRILEQEKITILNYDILRHWLPYLERVGFKTIVFDECQYLQNRSAKRTEAAIYLSRGIPHCLALSGTPLTNRPADMFPILNILWPNLFSSFWEFVNTYSFPQKKWYGYDYSKPRNLNALHEMLKRIGMIRYLKKDVLHDFPELVRNVIPMEIEDREGYDKAQNDFVGWLRENKPDKMTKALKAVALTQIGELLRLAAKSKLRGVVAWANQFLEETGEKLALFAVHRKCIDACSRRIKAKHVIIDGQVTGRDREAAKEQFNNDDDTRLAIINIRAGGVGLNLQKSCWNAAFAEMWWNPSSLNQAEGRIDRIGQKNRCFSTYFVGGGTIEERLCRIIQNRQEIIRAVLDGGSIPEQDINLYDLLVDEVRKDYHAA